MSRVYGDLAPRWRRYLRFWGRNLQADLDDELRFHLEGRIDDLMARGMSRKLGSKVADAPKVGTPGAPLAATALTASTALATPVATDPHLRLDVAVALRALEIVG